LTLLRRRDGIVQETPDRSYRPIKLAAKLSGVPADA
jgi:hypothetical protein